MRVWAWSGKIQKSAKIGMVGAKKIQALSYM